MIDERTKCCPICGGSLKYYDYVRRRVLSQNRQKTFIKIRRFRCQLCGNLHSEIPNGIMPFKHYKKSIITRVLNGTITSDTLEFEDFPCEMTMKRWITNLNK